MRDPLGPFVGGVQELVDVLQSAADEQRVLEGDDQGLHLLPPLGEVPQRIELTGSARVDVVGGPAHRLGVVVDGELVGDVHGRGPLAVGLEAPHRPHARQGGLWVHLVEDDAQSVAVQPAPCVPGVHLGTAGQRPATDQVALTVVGLQDFGVQAGAEVLGPVVEVGHQVEAEHGGRPDGDAVPDEVRLRHGDSFRRENAPVRGSRGCSTCRDCGEQNRKEKGRGQGKGSWSGSRSGGSRSITGRRTRR
ncbi:hypothetical protein SHKM778_47420 [Streptomyces sp. KM77-8]|uniref:Uncharacterized protein n=1 Tax=Streptomyces haneummycinicus TaxID=3074435 RepID=A0AAT9HM17_9ACTN